MTERSLSYTIDNLLASPTSRAFNEPTPSAQSLYTDGVGPEAINPGVLTSVIEQAAGVIYNGKTGFNNTQTGYRLGIDKSNGLAKFYIGNTTDYLNWDGESLTFTGRSRNTVRITTAFEDLSNRFSTVTGGLASATSSGGGLEISVGTTANSYARVFFGASTAKIRPFHESSFIADVSCTDVGIGTTGNNGNFYIGISDTFTAGDGTNFTITNNQYGYKVVKADGVLTLYATHGNGTTETATSISTVTQNQSLLLSAVYRNGMIRYYVNDTLSATHTTSLPSTATEIIVAGWFFANNANTAKAYTWRIGAYSFEKLGGFT